MSTTVGSFWDKKFNTTNQAKSLYFVTKHGKNAKLCVGLISSDFVNFPYRTPRGYIASGANLTHL